MPDLMVDEVLGRSASALAEAPGPATERAGRGTDPGHDSATPERVALVLRARDGDRLAFDRLVRDRLEATYRLALGILGSEADARDATQDAFVAAWRGLPALRDPVAFEGWLTRITVNACRGTLRSRRQTMVREISVSVITEDDDPPSNETPVDERAAQADALERAFERLSAPERAILALHHLEHRPLAVIAEVLGIPVGTAKSRLFNARRALERALEAER
jgi:RNA polymerase sigma-70 factor, ECF subfamily